MSEPAVSPLLRALYEGRRDDLEALLAQGPELDVFEAAALGPPARVVELVDADRSLVHAWSPDGFTALHLACFFGQPAAAEILVREGADVNIPSRNDMRVAPLHSAAAGRQVGIARLLLEHGADPNRRQERGGTPIHTAAQNGDEELVKLLLASDADPSARLDDGRDAADLAVASGHESLAVQLR